MSPDDTNAAIRNAILMSLLGLFGWHLLTLHNISKSVDVLVHQMQESSTRIDRLENYIYYEPAKHKDYHESREE